MSEPSFSPKLVRPEGDSSTETLAADDMEAVREHERFFSEAIANPTPRPTLPSVRE